ncbi:MAG: glycosyltransferase [Victivallaceae bacterium]|nr:glycosyltransferase [Victivallaceae bacterium]
MNRYAMDLALAQFAAGNDVFVLYPDGGWRVPRRARIRTSGEFGGIRCFSLVGGPAVPLLEGVASPSMLLDCPRRLSNENIRAFWREVAPDVVHVHTWMGFPNELFDFIETSEAKMIYTTHDYFGLCPRVNRLRPDGSVCEGCNDADCSRCNRHAPDERRLALRNWGLLIGMRKFLLPLKRLLVRRRQLDGEDRPFEVKPFGLLRQHYIDWMRRCDVVHFNSPVTERIFTGAVSGLRGVMLPIAHGGIIDRRDGEVTVSTPLRLLFLGAATPYKGLPMLLDVLRCLEDKGLENWCLDVYGDVGENRKRVVFYGAYDLNALWDVLKQHDVLVVPSIWDETFGFVVAEALCCGVPVLCSDRAGAKILLPPEWVFSGKDDLKDKLDDILSHPDALLQRKKFLREKCLFTSMAEHVGEVDKLYRTVL